ncbi:MAG TPA: hypothetical protein PKW42_12365 [bacterium]|nr:hypothetical protein [bacterium]
MPNFASRMIEQGVLIEQEVTELEEQVRQSIEEATRYAIDSPWPEPEELYTDLYA